MLGLLGAALVVAMACAWGVGRLALRVSGRGFLFGAVLLGALSSAPEFYFTVDGASRGLSDLVAAGLLGGWLCNLTWLLLAFVATGRVGRGEAGHLAALASLGSAALLLVALGAPAVVGRPLLWGGLLASHGAWFYLSYRREGRSEDSGTARFGLIAAFGIAMAVASVAASFACLSLVRDQGLSGSLWMALLGSAPELALVFVAAWGQAPELGGGVALGAGLANLSLFTLADLFGPRALLTSLSNPQLLLLLCAGGVFLTSLALLGMSAGRWGDDPNGR